MATVKISDLIAAPFYDVHRSFVYDDTKTDFFLKGGRGSTKSTFAALEIALGIMRDGANGEHTNAIIFRRVGNTLRDSVYSQMLRAIDMLKVNHLWKTGLSPLRLTYKPTGQIIAFEGVDDPLKLKSIAVPKGYFKYAWFEELAEFEGIEHIRSIRQSVLRGGSIYKVLLTFNPPKSIVSWVNREVLIVAKNRVVHHSTYLEVPREWLGEQFIMEAEQLRDNNFEAYEHEYLGKAVGTGGQIFRNLVFQEITDAEIRNFDRTVCGLDWGFSPDPLGIVWLGWQPRRRRLLVFDEEYLYGVSNSVAADRIKRRNWTGPVICDNAEPKSIADLNGYGVRAIPCRKGKGSIERGMRWLTREVSEIVIDTERCPNATREFAGYEYAPDPNGGFKRGYPDTNNHLIDPTRYACQDFMASTRIR